MIPKIEAENIRRWKEEQAVKLEKKGDFIISFLRLACFERAGLTYRQGSNYADSRLFIISFFYRRGGKEEDCRHEDQRC